MAIAAAIFSVLIAAAQRNAKAAGVPELPPGSAELMQPQELVKVLHSASKPAVLYVGPRFLFVQAHIPGAEFIGPTADPNSLANLHRRMTTVAKNSLVVLYCGCCPWTHCPNIRPAYAELQKMGYKGVKVLYLANSFGVDWADKGYPVAKGQ